MDVTLPTQGVDEDLDDLVSNILITSKTQLKKKNYLICFLLFFVMYLQINQM